MSAIQTQILSEVEVVHLNINLWTGAARLTEADLGLPTGSLPPKELASLGSIKLINPEEIAKFNALKKRAQRLCEDYGVRFIGAYAVAKSRIVELAEKLDAIVDEGMIAKSSLISRYSVQLDEFCKEHDRYAPVIREKAPNEQYLANRIWFDYQVFQVSNSNSAGNGLAKEVGGLADKLTFEIAKEAKTIWDEQLEGRAEIRPRTLNSLRVLLDKMASLAFLNPDINTMANLLTQTLNTLPVGNIAGADLNKVTSLVLVLSDPDRMRNHAKGLTSSAATVSAAAVLPQKQVQVRLQLAPQAQTAPAAPAKSAPDLVPPTAPTAPRQRQPMKAFA